MNKRGSVRRLCLASLIALGFLVGQLPSYGVLAQNAPATTAQGGQGLEISPPTSEVKTDPGKTVTLVIKVRNITSGALSVVAEVNDFVAEGEDGKAKLLLNEGELSSFTLKEYTEAIPDFKLAAGEQKAITVTVNIPAEASPGGHYGAVRFTGTPDDLNGPGVALSASLGALVLVRVSGEVKEDLSVAEFSVNRGGKKGSVFETGPINVVERLKNAGNVHLKPQGEVRITNIFGQEVAKLNVNEKSGNVLPDSTRKFEQEFSKKILFGRYTANLNVRYDGQTGCLLTESVTFWVIPYKALGALLLLVLLLLVIVQLLHRRSNRKDIGSSLDNVTEGPGPFDDNEHDQIPPSIPTNPQL